MHWRRENKRNISIEEMYWKYISLKTAQSRDKGKRNKERGGNQDPSRKLKVNIRKAKQESQKDKRKQPNYKKR